MDAFRGRALRPASADDPGAFRREDAGPIAGLVAAHVAMFWRVLFTSDMFFFRDVFSYSYPHALFIRRMCLAGRLPYWNPTLNFGEPILANPNFLFFYPTTLLLVVLPLDLGYTLHYILHFILAGVGAYALARRWNQSRLGAFFAGFIFSFSGPVLSLGNLYNHAAAAAWIPWALLCTDLALASSSRRPWVLLTAVFGLQFLAAEPLTLMATFMLCLAYALFIAGSRTLLSLANLQVLAAFSVVGVLMIAVSAIAFLPSLGLLQNSRRGVEGLPFLETTSWSFHPLQLLEVMIPDFFGSSIESRSLWSSVLSNRNLPYFLSVFVGLIPMILAMVGLVTNGNRRVRFTGATLGILLVLAFGRFTPVFALVYLLFPPLAMVRFPVKFLIPMLLMLALLAGWGADTMRSSQALPRLRSHALLKGVALSLAVTVMVWLASFLAPALITLPARWILVRTYEMFTRIAVDHLADEEIGGALQFLIRMVQINLPGLAGFLLGAGLWIRGRQQDLPWTRRAVPAVLFFGMAHMAYVNIAANPTVPHGFYDFQPPVLKHFDLTGKPYRYAYVFRETSTGKAAADTQGFINFESIPEAKGLPVSAELPFRDRMTLARASMLTDAEGVVNIDVERSFPMALYDYWVFSHKSLEDAAQRSCLLGRSNVRYQVMKERTDLGTGREIAEIPNGSPAPHLLYEVPCTTPRAYAAGKAVVAATAREVLEPLSDFSFDALGTVFLPPGTLQPNSGEKPGAAGSVEISRYAPNEIEIQASLARPGYVVLLDRFDPSWLATVDDRETTVYRANHIFRAVRVPAGNHLVRFRYVQRGLQSGALISLLTLAFLAIVYFRR